MKLKVRVLNFTCLSCLFRVGRSHSMFKTSLILSWKFSLRHVIYVNVCV